MKSSCIFLLFGAVIALGMTGCRRDPVAQGIKAIQRGDLARAETLLSKAIEQDPQDATALANLALIHYKRGNNDAALTTFLQAAGHAPADARSLEFAGSILLDQGRWRDALDVLMEAARRDPRSARIQTALAIAELHNQGAAVAATRLAQVIGTTPDYGPALFNLAALNRDWIRNPSESRKYFQRYLVVAGTDPRGAIARAAMSAPRAAPAPVTPVSTAPVLAPTRPQPTPPTATPQPRPAVTGASTPPANSRNPQAAAEAFSVGIKAHQAGDLDKAAREYGRALQNDPSMVRAHYNLGLVLRGKGDLAGARSAFEQTLAGAPGMVDAHYMLALVLIDQRDTAAATVRLKTLLEKMPAHADAHLALGFLYKEDPAKAALARQEFTRYLELAPNGKSAREVRNWLKYHP